IASGCDAVFVCGGDGTIHDVLQGMIGTAASLAIIPLGTANTLAHDLRIPWNPAAAARVAVAARPRRVAGGRGQRLGFKGGEASRNFMVVVGGGGAGELCLEV